jgi:pimeloyl-ACP methyl ester carboxylesterase
MPRILTAVLLLLCTLSLNAQAQPAPADTLAPLSFPFKDGGSSVYYAFTLGQDPTPDTYVFFYGGSGCRSWHSVMPGYVAGLALNARVLVLNKRFVADTPKPDAACSQPFHEANNPAQWYQDYQEFILAQLAGAARKPAKVVLVGVSEGGLVAARVATTLPQVTHLAIIGDGAWSMRASLRTLHQRGSPFDVDAGWSDIATDPRSLTREWLGSPYRWWADIMDLKPLNDFLTLSIPILVGFGEKDENVPVESALALKAAFEMNGKRNLSLIIYPGANHRLVAGDKAYRPEFFAALAQRLQAPGP